MHKTCFKCGAEKPLDNFYPHPQMADGRLNKCKECAKSDVRLNNRKTRRKRSKYEHERFKEPARKRMVSEYQRHRRRVHPEKTRAYSFVWRAIKSGKITREPCEVCGTEVRVQAHHDDYSRELNIRWLCFVHHRELHGQLAVAF